MRKQRRYMTLRLLPDDRELLQEIGKGRVGIKDRHAALVELAQIVPELDLPDVREMERRPLRLGIPQELEDAIAAKVKETGQTFIAVLLAAARHYRQRHPASADAAE